MMKGRNARIASSQLPAYFFLMRKICSEYSLQAAAFFRKICSEYSLQAAAFIGDGMDDKPQQPPEGGTQGLFPHYHGVVRNNMQTLVTPKCCIYARPWLN